MYEQPTEAIPPFCPLSPSSSSASATRQGMPWYNRGNSALMYLSRPLVSENYSHFTTSPFCPAWYSKPAPELLSLLTCLCIDPYNVHNIVLQAPCRPWAMEINLASFNSQKYIFEHLPELISTVRNAFALSITFRRLPAGNGHVTGLISPTFILRV